MSPVLRSLALPFPRHSWLLPLLVLWEVLVVSLLRRRFRERDEGSIDEMVLDRIDTCCALGRGLLNTGEASPRPALYLLRGLRLALQAGAARRAAYAECIIASMPSSMKALQQSLQTVFEPSLSIARRTRDRELEAWAQVCAGMAHTYVVRGDGAVGSIGTAL